MTDKQFYFEMMAIKLCVVAFVVVCYNIASFL